MPLETNLNTSPYFDDYDSKKDFYKVLFRPGVAVQTRELNQLQTILQQQVERFGNHIFKNGTIISGCNFQYRPVYPYVKILDLQVDGIPVDLEGYENYFVRNSANLTAKVVETIAGFQSTDPDLNTLYIRYTNSGTGSETQYANNDVLTVFDINYPIFSVAVNNGGTGGLSNSDTVVFLSSLEVDVATGAFATNEVIVQATTNAHAVVTAVTATDNATRKILSLRPVTAHLTNTDMTSAKWTFTPGYNVVGQTSSAAANVAGLIGTGAQGVVVTDSLGIVKRVDVIGGGADYTTIPHVTIKPTSNSGAAAASAGQLVLTPTNYKAKVTVANSSFTAPVGNGFAFSVTEGIIFQKGHFLRVDAQTIVVQKYNNAPDGLVVSFITNEDVVTSTTDSSILDNATGTPNQNAPGANRLRLTPVLAVNTAIAVEGNTDFLALVEFVDGMPYKENRVTQYNALAQEFETRTDDISGNFVIDPFVITSSDITGVPNTSFMNILVDPGKAYIAGKKVETLYNTKLVVRRGSAYQTTNNMIITMNYGQYVRVNELAGNFRFKVGDTVSLRDTAKEALTSQTGAIAPGNEIGSARIRSLVYESGEPGSPEAVYRLYLFDLTMLSGRNFRDVRSVFYNDVTASNYDGIADIVLEAVNGTTGAVLQDMGFDSLLFPTGMRAVADISNNATFYYRTSKEDNTILTNGTATVTIVTSNERFPYTPSSNLTSSQEEEIIVVPVANLEMSANLTGTAVNGSNSTLAFLTGTATTWLTDLHTGDYVKIANTSGSSVVRRVVAISNNTQIVLNANTSIPADTLAIKRFYPEFVPIPTASRSNRFANLDATGKVLTLDFNETFAAQANCVAFYNVRRDNATQAQKTIRRQAQVRLDLGTNGGGLQGPWTLGVPDVARLRTVKLGSTALTNTAAWAVGSNATHGILTGTGTLANTELAVGDYVAVSNAISTIVRQVTSTPSNTSVVLDALTLPTGTLTGVKVFYSTNTRDITKHFFVDNGQTEDYYGLSKLVKNHGSSISLTANDYLIVEFDAFQKSGEGYCTVKSYAVDDTKTFAQSSNTVNTLEIPEFQGAKDYYDLRDVIDFRPYATATANLALNANGSANVFLMTSDPTSTVAFSASDKNFPTPDSIFQYNATQFLGRVDLVSVTKDGRFLVTPGTPSVSPRSPRAPAGGMVIGMLNIAPYPSLALNPSGDTVTFMSKRVGSYLRPIDVRAQTYVNKVAGIQSQRQAQTSRYTMADIANLERRISALEERAVLSALEAAVFGIQIKSSIDPTTSRYINGFLADPLNDYSKADMASTEYRAYVDTESGALWPQVGQVALECMWDGTHANTVAALVHAEDAANLRTAVLPYTEVAIVNQDVATMYVTPVVYEPDPVVPLPPFPEPTPIPDPEDPVVPAPVPQPPPTNYYGSMMISPSSFPIRARIEVVVTVASEPPAAPPPPPPVYSPPVVVAPAPAPVPPPEPVYEPIVIDWGGWTWNYDIQYGPAAQVFGMYEDPNTIYWGFNDDYWSLPTYDYWGVTGGGN